MSTVIEAAAPSPQLSPRVVTNLMREYPDISRTRIEAELLQAVEELEAQARILMFVPVLAERLAEDRLRNGGADAV